MKSSCLKELCVLLPRFLKVLAYPCLLQPHHKDLKWRRGYEITSIFLKEKFLLCYSSTEFPREVCPSAGLTARSRGLTEVII